MRPRIILTDADGTVVWWLKGFNRFMSEEKGLDIIPGTEHEYKMSFKYGIDSSLMEEYIREFNESARIGRLEPLADSVEYIDKLYLDYGFRFICVTSQSDVPIAKVYRELNLIRHFGNAFEEVNCLKMGSNKKEFLTRWKDSGLFWIEDHAGQAQAGADVGLKSVLISHPYNDRTQDDRIIRVDITQPWKEIYGLVLKDYNLV